MIDQSRVLVARVVASAAVVLAIGGCIWTVMLGYPEALWEDYLLHNSVVAVGFGVKVWLAIPSQPRNRVIWVSALAALLVGLVPALVAAVYQIMINSGLTGPFRELAPADLPFAAAVLAMHANWVWIGIMLVPTLVLLYFPDGRLPSSRWRWLTVVVAGLAIATSLGFMLAARPSVTASYLEIELSYGFSAGVIEALMVGYIAMFATIPFCVSALVVRFRRSQGIERQQFRWVMWGAAIAAPLLITAVALEGSRVEVTLVLLLAALVILIGSIGVAIGKYRLYDVDIVISRTVVFGVLAGFIGLIYATVSLGLGSMIGQSGSDWAPVLATAAVAFAFEPVRHLAQRWANRIAYGHRASPYEVLAELTGRLDGAEAAEGILSRIAGLLAEGTGAAEAIVWLGPPGSMTAAASSAETAPKGRMPDLDSDTVFSVTHDGSVVGALEVIKPRGTALSSSERALVEDMAGSASAVLGFQRLNESLTIKAAEIEASRRRMVVAEDQERKALERELNEGAQQLILALKVNVDLARRRAIEIGAGGLADFLAGLGEETQAALDEVRDLAKGIYPPVLESDGLGSAVSALAASAPVEVEVIKDGVGRYPADIEAAVYFDISEALTNAVKHAVPPVRIELDQNDGVLRFEVADSGPGFDLDVAVAGSGLGNLRDRVDAVGGRLTITSWPGVGTSVVGEIPLVNNASQAVPSR